MRTPNDCTYQEYKEGVETSFNLWRENPKIWTVENVTNFMISEEYNVQENPFVGTTRFLFFVSLSEFEIKSNILEERVLTAVSYHIYRYENMGRYKDDLAPEEIKQVEKDIAYIKSKVRLPELVSYDDME